MKKKLLSVILAVAVAFTFSFAMVGTASAGTVVDPDDLYVNDSTIVWNDDFTKATADIYMDMGSQDDVLYAKGVEADKYEDKTFNAQSGRITAQAWWAVGGEFIGNAEAKYIDLTDATVVFDPTYKLFDADVYLAYVAKAKAAGKTAYALDEINEVYGITVKCPEGVKSVFDTAKKGKAFIKNFKVNDERGNSLFSAINVGAANYEAYEEGTYELPVSVNEKRLAHIFATNEDGQVPISDDLGVDGVLGTPDNGEVYIGVASDDFAFLTIANTEFTYDGKEHVVAVEQKGLTTEYYAYNAKTKEYEPVAAIKVKNVADSGEFAVKVTHKGKYHEYTKFVPFTVTVNKKDLAITTNNPAFSKVYDGEGVVIDQSYYDVKGLVEGEVLITGAEKTKADVGVYNVVPVLDQDVAANYEIHNAASAIQVTITKADNNVYVKAGTYKVKRGSSKELQYNVKFGDAKFQKVSGTPKVKVTSKGVIKVAKSAKKGKIYSVKITASVPGTTNYNAYSTPVTLKVKVK